MPEQLGIVVHRIGRLAAILFAVLAILVLLGGADEARSIAPVFGLLAVAAWLAGRVFRYLFSPPNPTKSDWRTGNVLYRTGQVAAILFAVLAGLVLLGDADNARSIAALFGLIAVACWFAGRVLRYLIPR